MKFWYLRKRKWEPTFEWVKTSLECADKINSYHEDYPKYVEITDKVLQSTVGSIVIPNYKLLQIHRIIFADKDFKGKWRDFNVVVGNHQPPKALDTPSLMNELVAAYLIADLETLD